MRGCFILKEIYDLCVILLIILICIFLFFVFIFWISWRRYYEKNLLHLVYFDFFLNFNIFILSNFIAIAVHEVAGDSDPECSITPIHRFSRYVTWSAWRIIFARAVSLVNNLKRSYPSCYKTLPEKEGGVFLITGVRIDKNETVLAEYSNYSLLLTLPIVTGFLALYYYLLPYLIH